MYSLLSPGLLSGPFPLLFFIGLGVSRPLSLLSSWLGIVEGPQILGSFSLILSLFTW